MHGVCKALIMSMDMDAYIADCKDGGGACASFDLAVYPVASPVVRALCDCFYTPKTSL